MKNKWPTKKLGDVCEIVTGNTPKTISKEYYGEDILWAGPSDLDKGVFVSNTNKKLSKIGVSKGGARIVPAGSVLLSCIGNIGKIGIAIEDMATNQQINSFVPNQNVLDSKYLYYVLITKVDDFKHASSKMTLPIINKTKCSNIEIPLPPLLEQRLIAKTLDRAFEKIEKIEENTEKNLQNSKELFEVYLESVFLKPDKKWKKKTFEEVCAIESRLVDPRKKEFLNLVHVGAGNIETRSEKLVDLKTSQEENLISGKFLFDNSMVLYSKIRPYLIKIVRPNFNGLCSADIYPLVPKKELMTRDFLFFVLRSKAFTDYAIKGSARAGMPKVNREHLFAYSFYLPPISEQKIIFKKLDHLSEKTKRLEFLYIQKLDSVEELKKSVLSEVFSKGL